MGVPVFAFAAESGVALVPWSFGTCSLVPWSSGPLTRPPCWIPPPLKAACTIMEKKMETTLVYIGDIGIMEKKMETTI